MSSSAKRARRGSKTSQKPEETKKEEMEAGEGAKSSAESLTPKDAHFARLNKVIEERGCLGSMLVVGIERDDSDEEEEEEGEEPTYTAEQIATLRHIIINKSRDAALDEAADFASCGQADDGIAMFNTHSGNCVIAGIPGEVKLCLKKKLPARFDSLFALTYNLGQYDFWMNDNECWEKGGELETAIKGLAKAWRTLLKNSDDKLGIDTEYTRPGIEALLDKLKDQFKDCEVTASFAFNWRP